MNDRNDKPFERGDAPLISVLIVNYNGRSLLEDCLLSLEKQTFRNFEVVLVDNASHDDSAGFVEQSFPWVRVVRSEKNLGFGGGNNFGYPHCRGKFVYFLNNDVEADPSSLAELAVAIGENPHLGIFASFLIQHRDRTRADSAGDTFYTCGKSFTFANYPVSMFSKPRYITSACGGAALFSRQVLEKIGLFDADFFLNFEDLDLSFRAQHAGEKILFVPASRIYHYGGVSQGGRTSYTSLYYAERNFGLFVLKNFPAPFLIGFLPSILFVKTWGLLKAVWCGHPLAFVLGNLDFLRLLPGIPAKRRAILKTSVMSAREFRALFRKHWLREKIAFLNRNYDIPL
jgi:GT2 family glycosyltransferase